MDNILAHSIVNDLAGKSCTATVKAFRSTMGYIKLSASPSVCCDLPHFILTHIDVADYQIAYIGANDYTGLVDCDFYSANTLQEVQYVLTEAADRSKPLIIIADLQHLGEDHNPAMGMIADYLEDGDMWSEQVLISVANVTQWSEPNPEQRDGRLFRPKLTAQVWPIVIDEEAYTI